MSGGGRSTSHATRSTATAGAHSYSSASHQTRHAAGATSASRVGSGRRASAAHEASVAPQSHDAASMHAAASHTELNRNVQAPHAFQAGAYRQPQGYEQRHWGYGDRLPGAYYARDYWLTDFALYGLFGPPEGLVWVRVGPDALLIDQYTGEVVQADYGVFY